VFALETLVILTILRAAYLNFEFMLARDIVYIMQRKAIKSSFYFVLVVREVKIEILLKLRNTGRI
jgi:hypothetical protein